MLRNALLPLLLVTALARAAVAVETLEDELRRTIGAGGSALIVGTALQPLEARSVDGARRRVLTPDVKLATRAMADPRSHVVWYRPEAHGDELWALDLAGPVGTPPRKVAEGGDPSRSLGIRYRAPRDDLRDDKYFASVLLVFDGKAPRFARNSGDNYRACRAQDKCPRIVDAPFLDELARRAQGGPTSSAPERRQRVAAAADDGCPRCGEATPLRGTKLWAVYRMARGDCCHVIPALYDPIAKQFVMLPDGRREREPPRYADVFFHDAWVCPAGDALVFDGRA
jgi:hypothetical protein